MLPVLHAGGEDQEDALARVLNDLTARGAHEVLIIHELLDLARAILATTHMQLVGVGFCVPARLPQWAQVALHDHARTPIA